MENREKIRHQNIKEMFVQFCTEDTARQTFVQRHDKQSEIIKEFRISYPDDNDLFEQCFREKPKGKIEIVIGEITFHIRCFNYEDYVLAYSYGRVRGEVAKLNNEQKEWYTKTASAVLHSVANKDLTNCITIENVPRNLEVSKPKEKETDEELKNREIEYSHRARVHEEQHQLNKLFVPQEEGENIEALIGLRGEILALYRGGRNNAERIYQDLTRPSGIYEHYFRSQFQAELVSEETKKRLKEYLSVITKLEQKGYSNDEILAMLYWQPITQWRSIALNAKLLYSN